MKIGSLFSGIGGLDLGLGEAGVDTELCWRSEIGKELNEWSRIRHPGIPNLGDITEIDELPAVDLITAGFPCQPVSQAGERKGVDDERWLFDDIVRLVGKMDTPPVLFLENVPGLLSTGGGEPFRRVIHGLASLGFVGRYGIVAAADVGAPHLRKRWFCVAHHADTDPERWDWWTGRDPEAGRWAQPPDRSASVGYTDGISGQGRDPAGQPRQEGSPVGRQISSYADESRLQGSEPAKRFVVLAGGGESAADSSSEQPERRGRLELVGGASSEESGQGDQWKRAGHPSLYRPAAVSDPDSDRREECRVPQGPDVQLSDIGGSDRFGPYRPAVDRWEFIRGDGRAPDPLVDGRLAPEFVEWMMGYERGYVTAVMKRRPALRALGNAVVPQQAAAALEVLLDG